MILETNTQKRDTKQLFLQEQPSDYDHFSDGHPLGGGIIGGRDPLC